MIYLISAVWAYIVSSLAVIIIAALLGVSFWALRQLFTPIKRSEEFLINYETKEKGFQKEWLNIPYEEKWLVSDDGNKLYAKMYINPKPTKKMVFLLHGHNNCSVGQLKYLNLFLELGYNVFIPDHRFSGKSQGKCITFGHREKKDIIKWIDVIFSEYPVEYFGLFGESMGAATAIMVAARDKRVKFLVEYCGFANFEELSLSRLKKRIIFKLLYPFFWIVSIVCFGVKLKETNAAKAMKTVSCPTLIMHSKKDELVTFNNATKLINANKNAKVVLFENSLHARSLLTYPEIYTTAVADFIKQCQLKDGISE